MHACFTIITGLDREEDWVSIHSLGCRCPLLVWWWWLPKTFPFHGCSSHALTVDWNSGPLYLTDWTKTYTYHLLSFSQSNPDSRKCMHTFQFFTCFITQWPHPFRLSEHTQISCHFLDYASVFGFILTNWKRSFDQCTMYMYLLSSTRYFINQTHYSTCTMVVKFWPIRLLHRRLINLIHTSCRGW